MGSCPPGDRDALFAGPCRHGKATSLHSAAKARSILAQLFALRPLKTVTICSLFSMGLGRQNGQRAESLGLARSVWAALLSVSVSSASAATISLAPIGNDPAQSVVLVEGTLLPSDGTEFRSRVGSLTKAIVTFNSDGGSLLAGIEIGKTIRLKSFATVVLDRKRCASACAFAWLGGSPRFMGSDSFIGFHAAYVERGGRTTEIGVGNALLGSYLTQIGLSESAVVYITKAAPTEMTWLNFRDAAQIGIDVIPWESVQPSSKPPQSPTPPRDAGEDLATRARSFVTAIQSRWSDANSAELGWLDSAVRIRS